LLETGRKRRDWRAASGGSFQDHPHRGVYVLNRSGIIRIESQRFWAEEEYRLLGMARHPVNPGDEWEK
jgi:hypothetical protein